MVVRSRLATLLKIAVISLAAAFVQPCFPSTPAETDGHIVRFGVVRYTTPSTNQPIVDPIICQNNFRHSFSLTWSGKTCDIRRSL